MSEGDPTKVVVDVVGREEKALRLRVVRLAKPGSDSANLSQTDSLTVLRQPVALERILVGLVLNVGLYQEV